MLHTSAPITGRYTSSRMSVEVALAPRNETGLNSILSSLYTKGSSNYHHWLARGQFDRLYAPSAATRAAVGSYLARSGLAVQRSASPFLVRAAGTSQQVSAAFRTTLSTYHQPHGKQFFANSAPVHVPAALAHATLGVIGLTSTVSSHPADAVAIPSKATASQQASAGCLTPYPTAAQQSAFVTSRTSFPFGYGAGPGCSGLTPAQVNSIYGAPNAGPRGKGKGTTVALYQASAYQPSDVTTWAQQFYGPGYTPALQNVLVDGGPLNPQCPAGDSCPPSINGYEADVESILDIERVLTAAPAAKVVVYDSPNDFDGQTQLDGYTAIANDDIADTVSSSFDNGECALPTAFFQAENVVFEQMAVQGQSMLSPTGDWGPKLCLVYGINELSVLDPAAQPFVTAVGGTSFEGYNPGSNPSPGDPASAELVWNSDNLCQDSGPVVDGLTGDQWCTARTEPVGSGLASSGGSSAFWGRPFYQFGPGVNNAFTTFGNTATQCSLAATGTPCREVPDVSADSDTYTGYATYCTGDSSLPNSQCAAIESKEAIPGWFAVAGTSSSSPLWAGIAADMDSYAGHRDGFLNPLLYALFNINPGRYFNDITGIGQAITTEGLYPVTPGYDEATGIGTPKMAALMAAGS